jgi:hypothetical protein
MKQLLKFLFILSFAGITQPTFAQINAVITVPYNPNDPSVPFPAYSEARITLKAIFRSNEATGSYTVRWDENLNGDVSDDYATNYTMNSSQFLNIGRAITLPIVSQTQLYNITVQVHNNTTGTDYYGTYPVIVYDFLPSNDPREWTGELVTIMNEITKHEAMWYLHRNLVPAGTAYSAQITGSLTETYAISMALNLFMDNNRYPAYPPSSMNAYGFTIPERWTAENNSRWNTDPYAETSLRLLNYLVNNLYEFSGIPAGDESALCGYNPDGSEIIGNRIAGTADGKGLFNTITNFSDDGVIANEGMILEAFSKALPVLSGTPAQIGKVGVISKSFEYIVQQMVDAITYAQQDNSAPHSGGWYYDLSQGSYTNVEASQWDIWGLMAADKFGKPCGVMVTNLVKYRLANYLVNVQHTNGGVKRWTTYTWCNNFNYTSSAISAARWLGIDTFETTETAIPFTAYSTHSKGTLRTVYNKYLNFATTNWTTSIASDCLGYQDGLWKDGDYLSGNTNGIYNVTSNGNTFTMMAFGKSLPIPEPSIDSIGTHDWQREFAIYYQRAQKKDPTNYSAFGSIDDSYCTIYSQCCNGGSISNTSLAGCAVSRNTQSIEPIAVLNGNTNLSITAGCAGIGNGIVIFDPSGSYSPYINNPIDSIQIDFDSVGGIWWETSDEPDYASSNPQQTYEYTYADTGVFVATLRVFDQFGLEDRVQIQITSLAAANVAPTADSGGPYSISEGDDLSLLGMGDDANIPCGDAIVFDWDMNNDGVDDIFNEATPTVAWTTLAGFSLPLNTANTIRLNVTDNAGLSTESSSDLTIYQLNPEAAYTYTPETIYCNEEITFDASSCYHPNPSRTIVAYEWDFDNDLVFEESGISVLHTFTSYGNQTVNLRIEDDLGHTDTYTVSPDVQMINQAPLAVINESVYEIAEGSDLVLDASESSDPNEDCGDAIVLYEWDIDNNGSFEDAVDQTGVNPTVLWSDIEALFPFPANYETGEPSQTISLRVTDEFASSALTDAVVRIFSPVIITQNPTDVTADAGGSVEFTVSASGSEPFTYQWYKNAVMLSNTNASVLTLTNITVDDAGVYSCMVSNQETNAVSDDANLFVNQTNINAITDAYGLNMYPNPTSTFLTIELNNPNAEKMTIEIVDTAGEIVYLSVEDCNGYAFKKQLDIEHLNTGVYFCKISIGNYFTVRKIIKY